MSRGLQCHARKLTRQAECDILKMLIPMVTDRKRFIVIDQDLNTVGQFDKRRNAMAFAAGLQTTGTSATVIRMAQIVDAMGPPAPNDNDDQSERTDK